MRKTIVWASCLTLVVVGGFLASCDSKGSSPTASPDTTGTGNNVQKVSAAFSVVNPATGDTLLTNDVNFVTVKVQTTIKTGVTVKINGVNAIGSNGALSSKIQNVPVGITRYGIVATSSNDTVRDTVQVTRQLSSPQITATTGQPGQTDFTDSVTVQFKAMDANTDSIHYSTGGATVRILGSDPFVANNATKKITGTTTFRAVAYRKSTLGTILSDTTTATFVIGKTLGKPYFSTNRNDSFSVVAKLGIGGYGKDDTVRYTTDGGDPTRDNSRVYSNSDSILIQTSGTIIAKTFNLGNSSPTCTTSIKLNALTPVFSAKSGTYNSQIRLTIKSASAIPVYYTTDGSTPTNQSLKASDSMLVDSNVIVKAIAMLPGWTSSPTASATYKFKVANPALSFRTGNYDSTQILTITDSAAGASIRFTTDGSTPTCGSSLYSPDSALRLDSNVVIKARACRTGWDSSDVSTGNYTFKVAKIVFSPDSGIYRNYQVVKFSTRSPGVVFYVTRDSSLPSWNASGAPTGSTMKLTPSDTLLITKSQWLRVVASRNGWANSIPDTRRYVVEGDTLLVDDFEQNSLTNPIGYKWRFWACGYCVNTGIPDQMSAVADSTVPDWNKQIGFKYGKIDFTVPDYGSLPISDAWDGPGYAGYSVGVPDSVMGETYRIVFWAKWVKGAANLPDSMPMVTEVVLKKNDNQSGAYHDGFDRYVEWVGSTWHRYVIDYQAFRPSSNAYRDTKFSDSTATTPKSWWLVDYPDSARVSAMGLTKFQGRVDHHTDWAPHWVWDSDHDHWSKGDIHAFRWSILQPSTDISTDTNDDASIRQVGRKIRVPGLKDTLVDSSYTDTTGGSHQVTVKVTHKVPTTYWCGDCHYPEEPDYSDAVRAKFLKGLRGSLLLDRIQLVRRPQPLR